ncbi:prepilin-type N-terminal cleavage/methylation domain-containing protein [Rhizobacter sp. AJA081-3]|uniref:type IV pilus modification PilV family protein n=1 Tax=Rhizobacter sp. AJA081-3 TaxID=2753607 RepID=UPI001AE0A3D3|nr:prepilin-type N-terminal cleavage/methylation domain-containing protein [Rhizobacter sp. AJA081-3]QTN21881.1 prepilin-type N-terminal cleavage/methylation domain-containing protein [Rhizobacter sp. AJA081-3]
MRKKNQSRGARARGSSLIEVLVSILIMSFGILGVVGLHARAIQFSLDADDRNRAALFGDELAAQMRLARSVNLSAAQIDTFTKRVQGLDLVTNQPNGSGLPNANVAVAAGATPNVATLTITWRHPGQPVGQLSQFVMDVVLTDEEIT